MRLRLSRLRVKRVDQQYLNYVTPTAGVGSAVLVTRRGALHVEAYESR
jgi:hypothetical protein